MWIVEPDGGETRRTFAELSACSNQVANWLREHGVARGDRVIVMLGNQVELWETILATMKLGAVIIPATRMLGPDDLVDRVERGKARHVVVPSAHAIKFKPKLVEHTHASYPVGHLSTMYWIGLQPGDVHLNVSTPGWAKHAWSNVYAPWLAEACVMLFNFARFDAPALLDQMVRCQVSTFCAPPTVWRMLIQQDLGRWQIPLREALAAGEPLNPEVIEQVRRQWDITGCSTRSAANRPRRVRSRSISHTARSG